MRVFLAGAGGAIGRRLLPRLIGAGHEVTGLSRSEERAERIRAAGAERWSATSSTPMPWRGGSRLPSPRSSSTR